MAVKPLIVLSRSVCVIDVSLAHHSVKDLLLKHVVGSVPFAAVLLGAEC